MTVQELIFGEVLFDYNTVLYSKEIQEDILNIYKI